MKQWEIEWEGEHVSLNDLYSMNNWRKRHQIKKYWRQLFSDMIDSAGLEKINQYELYVYYNSRLDPSNVSAIVKLFEDTLKTKGFIIDDSKKYCKGIHIIPDLEMRNKQYKVVLRRCK
ncbi:hypothetical protein OAA64_01880 [bacterium]|nr:hypothetical protein [bacterium]